MKQPKAKPQGQGGSKENPSLQGSAEHATLPHSQAPRLMDPGVTTKCVDILGTEYHDTSIAAWFSAFAAVVTRSRAGTADKLTRGLPPEVTGHPGAYAPDELRAPVLGLLDSRLQVYDHNRGNVDEHEAPPSLRSKLRVFFIDATEPALNDRHRSGTHDNTLFAVTPTADDRHILQRGRGQREEASSYRPVVATARVCDPSDLQYVESAGQTRQQRLIHQKVVQFQVLAAKSADPAEMGKVLGQAQLLIDQLPVPADASTKVPPIDHVITTAAYAPFASEIVARLGPNDRAVFQRAYETAMRGGPEASAQPRKKSILGTLFGGK